MVCANVIKVSVIIPAFNVEPYLKECLNSLISQTLKEIEIIVIDDGSTDKTGKLADEFVRKDSRVRAIHQENRGLAAARNQGIDLATGEYIAFVDSDDWVKTDAYEHLYECAKDKNVDVVLGSIVCYEQGKEGSCMGEYTTVFGTDKILIGKECLQRLIRTGYYLPMVFMNLYRTEFIKNNDLCFKYQYHEDEYFTPYALYYAQRVIKLDEVFYYYRIREGSIMLSANKQIRTKCYYQIANDLFDFGKKLLGKEKSEIISSLLLYAIFLYIRANQLYFLEKPALKLYELNLWKEYLGQKEYLRLKRMYFYFMNQQKVNC